MNGINSNAHFPWLIAVIGTLLFSLSYYLAKKEAKKKKREDITDISLLYFLKGVNILWYDLLLLFFLLYLNAESILRIPVMLSYLIFISLIIIQLVFYNAGYKERKRNAIATLKSSYEIRNQMLEISKKELKEHIIGKNLRYLDKFAHHYNIDGIKKIIHEIEKYMEKPSSHHAHYLGEKIEEAIEVLRRSKNHRHFNYAIYALKNIQQYLKK